MEIRIEDFDLLAGRAQAVRTEAANAQADAGSIAATGSTSQIVGFDSGGNPQAKSVAGDSLGAGLAFSGNTLTATLSQSILTGATPTFAGAILTNTLTLGGGVTVKKIASGSLSGVDPGSIAAQTRGSVDVTLTGAAVGDVVVLVPPDALHAGLVYGGCRVTGANTLRIYLANLTGGAVDDGASDWLYLFFDVT